MNKIYFGDNLPILQGLESESVDLIYIDPPFNTGRVQKRTTIKTVRSENGSRKGFQGKNYETTKLGTTSYADSFDSLVDFLRPRLVEAHRILKPHGSLYFHIDYREVHYCKILLDEIFGRDCFLNEIIWAYDYGGRAKSKWPPKHDNILYYVKDPENYIFNGGAIDREQYIAPGLVGPAKAERGKLPTDTWWFSYVGKKPTDTWWQTIVPTNGRERVGYPTQKPRKLLDRMINASSYAGMVVLDFFAGSGTLGESCLALDRQFILMDNNPASVEVMAQRFAHAENIEWVGFVPPFFEEKQAPQKPDTDAIPVFDAEYLMLAASITHIQDAFEEQGGWADSPFEWVVPLSDAQKEIVGRHLILSWCQEKGLLTDAGDEALIIDECKLTASFAILSPNGDYVFQPMKKENSDAVFCFGISPKQAHAWVIKNDEFISHAEKDHSIRINPETPPLWLSPCGGTLDQAFTVLKNLSHRK